MQRLDELEREIQNIKERNKRVEAEKSWETSWTRRVIIFILTYMVILTFFLIANIPKPFFNSVIPALAFVLSTLSLPVFKKGWLRYIYNK